MVLRVGPPSAVLLALTVRCCVQVQDISSRTTASAKFPAMWFGANESGAESPAQLQVDFTSPLVIYGWQHGFNASDGGSLAHIDAGERGSAQCAALKRAHPQHRCFVYMHAALAMPLFAEQRAVLINRSRDHWFIRNPRRPARFKMTVSPARRQT